LFTLPKETSKWTRLVLFLLSKEPTASNSLRRCSWLSSKKTSWLLLRSSPKQTTSSKSSRLLHILVPSKQASLLLRLTKILTHGALRIRLELSCFNHFSLDKSYLKDTFIRSIGYWIHKKFLTGFVTQWVIARSISHKRLCNIIIILTKTTHHLIIES